MVCLDLFENSAKDQTLRTLIALTIIVIADIFDVFYDRFRRNMMLFVIRQLDRPSSFGLRQGIFHGPGYLVAIKDNPTGNVPCCPSDRLDKRSFCPKKSFLIRVKYSN